MMQVDDAGSASVGFMGTHHEARSSSVWSYTSSPGCTSTTLYRFIPQVTLWNIAHVRDFHKPSLYMTRIDTTAKSHSATSQLKEGWIGELGHWGFCASTTYRTTLNPQHPLLVKPWSILQYLGFCYHDHDFATARSVSSRSSASANVLTQRNAHVTAMDHLQRQKEARMTYLSISVLRGVLYLPSSIQTADVQDILSNSEGCLEIVYERAFTATEFKTVTKYLMKSNLKHQEFSRLENKIKAFLELYTDVKRGDTYRLWYHPDHGTQLFLNDELRGTIEGADMGEAIFRMWFGAKPFNQKFKKDLTSS